MRAGAWRAKGELHSEKDRFQGGRRGHAKRTSLKVGESVSGRWKQKLSMRIWRALVSLQLWPNLKWERRLGDERPAYKMSERNESG